MTQKSSGKKPIAATKTKDSFDGIKEKRAWDFATGPAKQLPMQAFMLYMSGGGVQIFSMGIVFMLLMTPFKNIFAMNEGEFDSPHSRPLQMLTRRTFPLEWRVIKPTAFSQFAPSSSKDPKATSTLIVQKLLYVVCNLLTLGVGLWKCRSMGLLPTGSGDWLAFETRGPVSRFGNPLQVLMN